MALAVCSVVVVSFLLSEVLLPHEATNITAVSNSAAVVIFVFILIFLIVS
jgi:hypothetical protein